MPRWADANTLSGHKAPPASSTLWRNRSQHSGKLAIRPMATADKRTIVATMNSSCPTTPLSPTALPAPAPASRGLFARLERIINTAGFVSVDLTDTIFASLPSGEGAPVEPVVPTLPLPNRPDQSRMLSVRLP